MEGPTPTKQIMAKQRARDLNVEVYCVITVTAKVKRENEVQRTMRAK